MKTLYTAIALASLPLSAGAATITVTTLVDTIAADGVCSLREAFVNAASNAATNPDCTGGELIGTDTITFASALFPPGSGLVGTFQIDPGQGPLIAAGGSLALQPPPNRRLHLVADSDTRLLQVDLPANRALSLHRTHLIGGYAAGDGGAMLVRSGSIVHLEDCEFAGNHADGSGGAIGFDLSTNATIRSIGTRFVANSADADGGAIGAVMATRINLDFKSSRFSDNIAVGAGGAIFMSATSQPLSLQASHTIADSIFADNRAGSGGAIRMYSGNNTGNRFDLLIEDSRFSGNQSLAPNVLGRGGALNIGGFEGHHTASVTLLRNSFHDNIDTGVVTGLKAGGVFVEHADAIVENNLFARNRAGHGGGGFAFSATGDFPGLPAQPRVLSLRFNSFFENELEVGGGSARGWDLLIRPANGTAPNATVHGNLFKAHPDIAAQSGCVIETVSGDPVTLTAASHNLGDRVECALGTQSHQADPLVAYANQHNGSHARTLHLEPASPGRDRVPEAACLDSTAAPLTEDLLRALRPLDGDGDEVAACDAGAFEAGPPDNDSIFSNGFETE